MTFHLKLRTTHILEVGKVTYKNNGDEALSDESLLKSNNDEAFNDDFPQKVMGMKHLTQSKNCGDEAFNASQKLKQ